MSEEADHFQSFEFKAEVQQLLNILVHSLYTEREIFLRELISNASDALNRVQFEMLTNRDVADPDAELAIHLHGDADAGTLTISDSGIGMTRDEVVRDLGTIAHSGAAAFLQQLQEEKRPAVEMIGQFGVGFYSVFMVAEEVRVVSRSFQPGAEAVEWVSEGGTSFRVAPAERSARGTSVEIKLKEEAKEFADTWRLEQIVKKHSDFVQFPIYVGDKKEPVNRRTALWRKPPKEVTAEQYNDFYKHLTLDFEPPLLAAHLVTDAPADVRAILYVPSRREQGLLRLRTDHGLKLYVRNVLIQEYNKDLLPNHWRFVEGVVESEDLPLNVARETVQASQAGRRIQKALVRKLVKELETMGEERPDDYRTFWQEFGPFLKEGIAADPSSQGDLLPLLRFHSSRNGEELVSLRRYVEKMAEGQEAIYYLLGDDVKSAGRSPHLDYFRAHDVEVLYLVDPIDSFMVMNLREFDGKQLKNVDDAGLDLAVEDEARPETPAVAETDFNRLVGRFVKVLGERVLEVRESRVLKDSPCRLVSPEDAAGRDMARVYRLLGQEYEVPRRILELNRGHAIIGNLAHLVTHSPESEVIDNTIELLFESQLLVEGLHRNPTDMIPRLQRLMAAATAPAQGAAAG